MIPDLVKEKCVVESWKESVKHHNTIRVNTLAFKQVFHPVSVTGKIRKDASGEDVRHGHTEKGEVFTPIELVLEILDQLPDQVWEDGKTYLDPTCGNGQFLAAVLIIKMELGHKNPLSTIYGADIMQDNVNECRQRLIDIAKQYVDFNEDDAWEIVCNNIRCENGLTYDYSFDKELSLAETLQKESIAPKKKKKEQPKQIEIVDLSSL